ncbi:MAG: response regulator transcription factor [Verrucomicrobiaceae bacterium]|nr:response regulator transcription factor [Verrucomicrobiaceae bacterium]
MKLLVVEDDVELARQLEAELRAEGHLVTVKSDGIEAGREALKLGWDVIVMDVQLPSATGFQIIEVMRRKKIETPVIFLTARGDVKDRVRGLSLGGDDYMVKPFAIDELKARIHALSRRSSPGKAEDYAQLPAGWKINAFPRRLSINGQDVALAPREWSLLDLFLSHPGQIMTKNFLLDRVWGIQFDPGTNVVDSMICRLRKKVDPPGRSSHVETVRGRGYRFQRDV